MRGRRREGRQSFEGEGNHLREGRQSFEGEGEGVREMFWEGVKCVVFAGCLDGVRAKAAPTGKEEGRNGNKEV